MSTLLPHVIDKRDDGPGRVILTLHVQAGLDYFAGHFPEFPVLPGVVQTDWAVRFGREHLDVRGDFVSLDNLKFQAMVMPGATMTLALEWQPESRRLDFLYTQDGQIMSAGRISFAAR